MFSFHDADPEDRTWWLRAKWSASAIESHLLVEYLDRQTRHTLAFCNPGFSDEVRSRAVKQVDDYATRCSQYQLPWVFKRQRDETKPEDLRDLWSKAFGDPEDPEVAEQIRRTAEFLQRTNKAAPGRV